MVSTSGWSSPWPRTRRSTMRRPLSAAASLQHVEELGRRTWKEQDGGEQDAARRQAAHRAQVDLLVAPERARDGASWSWRTPAGRARWYRSARALRSNGREASRRHRPRATRCCESPLSAAFAAPRSSASRSRRAPGPSARPPRQVKGEAAVVGEAVERPAARDGPGCPASRRLGRWSRKAPVFWPVQGAAR